MDPSSEVDGGIKDFEEGDSLDLMRHESPRKSISAALQKRIDPAMHTFSPEDPRIKRDVLALIVQYLQDEGFHSAAMVLEDESSAKVSNQIKMKQRFKRIQQAVIAGDWNEVERLFTKPYAKKYLNLHYAIYRQQYLELVDRQEYQKALTFLTRHLKPLEAYTSKGHAKEFQDLCYLLSCKAVQDAPAFKDWEGITVSREKLAERFENLPQMENFFEGDNESSMQISPHRLTTLLQQAVAYQIEFSHYHPRLRSKVCSLIEDYQSFVVPNVVKSIFQGHTSNVKSIDFLGSAGQYLASGSSDRTIRIWDIGSAVCLQTLQGHNSRVWDVKASLSGRLLASASGDSTLRLWGCFQDYFSDSSKPEFQALCSLHGTEGDVYCSDFNPTETHVAFGGYDKEVHVYDIETQKPVLTISGHDSSIASVIFNPLSNLLVTGSKDCSIRFWDVSSGVCVKSLQSHLGEVTSVEFNHTGSLLLSGSKDNTNRLWDIRTSRCIQRYKGHQNTFKNFIRCSFGPGESVVVGGSEDGLVHVWDLEKGDLLNRLEGHKNLVYSAKWNSDAGILATCSEDHSLRTWTYDPSFVSEGQS